jgi:DNA-binding MarR family transcriptional regulator
VLASESNDPMELAWARLLSLFMERRDATFVILGQHGLTPPHAHALSLLLDGPVRMRDLAAHMTCDASYITAVTDRLEELGLAERRPSDADRRVKEVALTNKGTRVAEKVRASFSEPPAGLAQLSAPDRKAFIRLCEQLAPDVTGSLDPLRPSPRSA